MERLKIEKIKENTLTFDKKKKKYLYVKKNEEGLPPYERCIELAWLKDKVSQVNSTNNIGSLFDFGCNKAEYIKQFKDMYNLKTYGVDMKREGRNYVDIFFHGIFDKDIQKKIEKTSPYSICTAISAIEHAGTQWHPKKEKIDKYQLYICNFCISISTFCFISVPFGKRPGWAKDKSRKNFYQFDKLMIEEIFKFCDINNKSFLLEFYVFRDGYWYISTLEDTSASIYRDNKGGASSVCLMSIF